MAIVIAPLSAVSPLFHQASAFGIAPFGKIKATPPKAPWGWLKSMLRRNIDQHIVITTFLTTV
jgi:hypothetical protein